MIPFTEYLLEYIKSKQNAQMFGASKIRSGTNGKVFDRVNNRKNVNTVRKDYDHKSPIVNSIAQGKANNIQMAGGPLLSLLKLYDTEYEPNTIKTLGNSGVEVQLMDNQRGIVRSKKKGQSNGL